MVEKTEYVTREGLQNLEKRFEYLQNVRRQEVAERLRQALEDGGELTENTQYETAKNEQAFVEAEINRIRGIINNAQIIADNISSDIVQIGSMITLVEKGTKDEENYRLVGAAESNPRQGKLSIESPLGQAVLGKKVGNKVTISAPDGDLVFKIKSIE